MEVNDLPLCLHELTTIRTILYIRLEIESDIFSIIAIFEVYLLILL